MKRSADRLLPFALRLAIPLFIGSILITGTWLPRKGFASETKSTQSNTYIECQGTVYAQSRYTLKLNPGESIQQIHVTEGQAVKNGALLVTLNNDQLVSSLADLLLKQNALQEAGRELRLLKLELKQKEQRYRELTDQIADGQQLMKQIPSRSAEREFQPLLNRQKDQLEQLELLRMRINLMQSQNPSNKEVVSLIGARVIQMRQKVDSLSVRAPFSGRMQSISAYPERLTTGQVVLDLYDQDNLLVHANVLQHQLIHIQIGDPATIYLDFGNQPPLPATVKQLLPGDMNPSQENYPSFGVVLKIDKQQAWIRPAMKVRVRLGDTKHQ